ncbi:hypothetical protein ONZ43_g6031 [Nemania bipapillata]|uniref:Uncharacterized protein n=1 Tax=Nemania bipapillata TaxID=110536 RepID=A0ACC2I4Y2_9PEZI|nr:hypothetical protein ONZ43_g6031 [Nemania bipapillata]
MQFTTSLIALLAAAVANAAPAQSAQQVSDGSLTIASNSWAMQTWSGTSCTGTQFFWSAPDGFSCTDVTNVRSLDVTNTGGCSTTYFTGSGCQGSPVHVDSANSCDGYSQGESIESFSVSC